MINILTQASVPQQTENQEAIISPNWASTAELLRPSHSRTPALAVLCQVGMQIIFGQGFHLAFRWVLTAVEDERLPGAIWVAGYVSASLSLLLTYLSVGRCQSLYLLGFCALVGSYFPLGSEDWYWRVMGSGIAVISTLLLIPLTQPPARVVTDRGPDDVSSGVRTSPDGVGLSN